MSQKKDESGRSPINVHLIWAICVIIGFVVWNFSLNWGNQQQFVSSVYFAFGLSSLIVGVYAIFQGLFSSQSFSALVSDLNRSARYIEDSASDIQRVTQALGESIRNVPDRLEKIDAKLENISQRHTISQLNQDINTPTAVNGAVAFLRNSTNGGRVSLYACLKSYEERKSFSTRGIFSDHLFADYSLGFIAAAIASDTIGATWLVDEGKYIITSLNNLSPENIKSGIDDYVSGGDSEYLIKLKKEVDDFFSKFNPADQ